MKYLYLSGEVASVDIAGAISLDRTRSLIAAARAADPAEPITIVLNSFGGDVTAGVAVYNLLRASRPVSVVVSGIAASIASVIAMAGDHVAMYDNSTLFLHHAWSFAEGNAAQMRERTAELEAADRVLIDAYVRKSGRTEQEIVAVMDGPAGDGSSLTAARALELGLIDEILDPAQAVAACLKKSFSEPRNKPETTPSASASESGQPQLRSTPMAAEPEITTSAPAAECGGDPARTSAEEVVEIEKEVKKEEDGGSDRTSELEKKVEELTAQIAALTAAQAATATAAPAASQAAQLKANIAQARAQAAAQQQAGKKLSWPECIKAAGSFAKACELYPDERQEWISAELAKGSIR